MVKGVRTAWEATSGGGSLALVERGGKGAGVVSLWYCWL